MFFANSGAEATEAAIKATRRLAEPGRRTSLVATEGAFHGRTLGALALTHKSAYREPFEPLPPGVVHVPFGDVDALAAALDDEVAAVVLEPIQGEAGVRMPAPGYLGAARELTTRAGALLVLDEVQSGIGRTGCWFAHQNPVVLGAPDADPPLVPDLVTLAKGLGGGIPIGALIALGDCRRAARTGPARHHLRRQLRRGRRGPGHVARHRAGRPVPQRRRGRERHCAAGSNSSLTRWWPALAAWAC